MQKYDFSKIIKRAKHKQKQEAFLNIQSQEMEAEKELNNKSENE